jgi:hypothetical protein
MMERPDTAIAIIKDFCPTSGAEVEGYINQLESRLASVTDELIKVKGYAERWEARCQKAWDDSNRLGQDLLCARTELIQLKEKLEKVNQPEDSADRCKMCGAPIGGQHMCSLAPAIFNG